jgi:hypothetical protein
VDVGQQGFLILVDNFVPRIIWFLQLLKLNSPEETKDASYSLTKIKSAVQKIIINEISNIL